MNVFPLLLLLFSFTMGLRPFKIETREVRTTLKTKDPIFNKLGGFYGLIGPDVDTSNVRTLYELFTGDGLVQGVFIDKGNITFVKHFVRTEKLLFESIHGRFSKNIMMTPLYVLLNKLGCLPNVLGLANTAFLDLLQSTDTGRHMFALFERDHPYQLYVDFENQKVSTIKKKSIPGIAHFSGHSKIIDYTIHTIDYDVVTNKLYYIRLNRIFGELSKAAIQMNYIPLIHDFAIIPKTNGVVFIDAPFSWDLKKAFTQIPVVFDATKPTYICLYDPITKMNRRIVSKDSFYIFHYADVVEHCGAIDIYAPLYDHVDFSSLDISGKYRKIRVLPSGKVVIKKSPALERMNLDFPQKWGSYVILREIQDKCIVGFVVCKGLDIIRRIRLPHGRKFCGEPAVVEIDGSPYLVGLAYDEKQLGYFTIIGIFTDKYAEQDVASSLTIGFHSIYLYDPKDNL